MGMWQLIVPQAWVAATILTLLALLGVGAMFALRRARGEFRVLALKGARGDLDHELMRSTNEHTYIASLKTSWEHGVEALPSAMLIIGLMGTFIGLALAINEAAAALSSTGSTAANPADLERQIHGLSDALKAVGIKFQTSIYGITFSLLVRAVAGFVLARERALLERTLGLRLKGLRDDEKEARREQLRWNSDQLHTIVDRCDRLLRLDALEIVPAKLGAQIDALALAATALRGSIDAIPEQLHAPIAALNQTLLELGPTPARLGMQVEALSQSAQSLRSSLESFDKVASRAEQFTAAATALTQATTRLDSATSKSLDHLARSVDASTTIARSMADSVGKLNTTVAESAERTTHSADCVAAAAQSLADVAKKLEGATTTALGEFARSSADGVSALKTSIDAFDKAAVRAKNFSSASTALTEAVSKLEKASTGSFEKIARRLEQDSERTAAAEKQVADSLSRIEDLTATSGSRLATGVDGVAAALKSLTGAAAKLEGVAIESSKQVAKSSQEGVDALHTALEVFDNAGARTERIAEVAANMAEATARFEATSSASADRLARAVASGADEIAGVTRALGDAVARMERADVESAERAGRSVEALTAVAQRLVASTSSLEAAAAASFAQAAQAAAKNTSALRSSLESFDQIVGRMGGFVDSATALANAASRFEVAALHARSHPSASPSGHGAPDGAAAGSAAPAGPFGDPA